MKELGALALSEREKLLKFYLEVTTKTDPLSHGKDLRAFFEELTMPFPGEKHLVLMRGSAPVGHVIFSEDGSVGNIFATQVMSLRKEFVRKFGCSIGEELLRHVIRASNYSGQLSGSPTQYGTNLFAGLKKRHSLMKLFKSPFTLDYRNVDRKELEPRVLRK